MGHEARRRRIRLALSLAVLSLAAGGGLIMVALVGPPAVTDPPLIGLSVDRTWWHRAGVSRFTYGAAIRRAGGQAFRLDYGRPTTTDVHRIRIEAIMASLDGLLLSGGGDVDPALYDGDASASRDVKPARDRFELALLREAMRRGLPVLGICRGHQLLNVARGGTLKDLRDDPELRRRHSRLRSHPIRLEAGSRLAGIFGVTVLERVKSYHGQAVDRVGHGLRVVGESPGGLPEALESSDEGWLAGVQWHPELTPFDTYQRDLFKAFVDAAREHRRQRLLDAAEAVAR